MRRFFVGALVVLMAACVREQQVVLVSTNDIHSSIDNFGRLATLVEELRAEYPGRVLLVDGGDRWTGNPFVDLAEKPLSPVIELMNELGYDVATLGNHEFDWGQPLLRERVGEMDFRVVCANISSNEAGLGGITPYVIVEAGGMRFAFLGLVTNFTRWQRPEGKAEHFEGLVFPDIYETAEKYGPLADSVDVFVGLTHIGARNDSLLAVHVPSFDLIIGGDSHTVIDKPRRVGNTLVTQTGSSLKYAGVTVITLRRGGVGSRGGRDERSGRGGFCIDNRLVMLDTIPSSPRIDSMLARYNANPQLLAPVGRTAAPFDEQGVENLVTDAIRAATGADLALYHSGGIRIDTLAGAVSTADLHRIEPFLSEVYTLHLTSGQLKGLLMGTFNGDDGRTSHRADILPSGFVYTIVTDEAGEAVDVVLAGVDGSPLGSSVPGSSAAGGTGYLVAVPDYLYKNYVFDRSGDAVETGRQVTSALREYIVRNTPLRPENEARIVIE